MKSPTTTLPDIDASLLVLMGISQGSYLGKKLVTRTMPRLYSLSPPTAHRLDTVTLQGDSLGSSQAGPIMFNGHPTPITADSWSDTSIVFKVPDKNPLDGGAWAPTQVVQVGVLVNGQTSNTLPLTVLSP
jgi:hypothetical protein